MKQKLSADRTVRTALDDLDYGTEEPSQYEGRVGRVRMPEGVSRGRLLRDVAFLAWPSFIELLLTQLTSMADQIMVGRMPGMAGVQGLSAVGLSLVPRITMVVAVVAMNVGTTAVIARCRGRQDQQKANQVFHQALLLNLIISAVMTVVCYAGARWMIAFMGSSGITEETLELSTTYLKIQVCGLIPLCLTTTITAALRGVGDTKTPMVYNTIANVVNVIFNYLLIYGSFGLPAMGVAGASLATVLGQLTAFGIAAAAVLGHKRYLCFECRSFFRFDRGNIAEIMRVGLPSLVEQVIMRIGFLIFNRMVASLGDTLLATHLVLVNLQDVSLLLGMAFGNAATTLMGQSLGKRRLDMAALYMRMTRLVGLGSAFVMMLVMILFNTPLIALYNSTPEVISLGSGILLMIAVMQPVQGDQYVVSGGLRGAGDTRFTAFCMLVATLVVRTICSVLFIRVLDLGLYGAWYAIFTDQALRTVLMAARYHAGTWKRMEHKRKG